MNAYEEFQTIIITSNTAVRARQEAWRHIRQVKCVSVGKMYRLILSASSPQLIQLHVFKCAGWQSASWNASSNEILIGKIMISTLSQ